MRTSSMPRSQATVIRTEAAATAPRYSERTVRLILGIDRAVYRFARHWLFFVNGFLFVYVATIVLAPLLASVQREALTKPIYAFHGLFCHQRPDRSFFLWGEKMACCQRCAAIYGSMFVLGCLFVAARSRLKPPSWRTIGLLLAPIAIDGLTQIVGLRESNAALRVVTGALFAVAACWLLFSYLESGFAEMRQHLERRFARLVAEGRTRPL